MKTKDKQDLRVKTTDELKKLVEEIRVDLFKMKLEHSMRKLKGTQSIFNKKKDVARILTILREKEILHASN